MKRAITSRQQVVSNTEQQFTLDQQSKTESTAHNRAIDNSRSKLSIETATEQTSNEDVITIVREYDTSQPTDDKTGTPPLKKETTQTRRKADTGKQQQTTGQTLECEQETTSQAHKEQTTNISLQAQAQQHSDTATQVTSSEKRGLNAFQQVLCSIGLLGIVCVIVWLIYKFKRSILKH